jgi:hypothetical protein
VVISGTNKFNALGQVKKAREAPPTHAFSYVWEEDLFLEKAYRAANPFVSFVLLFFVESS